MSLSEEQLDAWNASAHDQPSLEWLHKTVCVAYYLPEKYQVGSLGWEDLNTVGVVCATC